MYAYAIPFLLAVSAVLSRLALANPVPLNSSNTLPSCRYLPGDAHWPSPADWDGLNRTLGGRLIAGKPLAQACHGFTYNADACTDIREKWTEPLT